MKPRPTGQFARSGIVRLVAVLAVLVGIVMLQSSSCSDEAATLYGSATTSTCLHQPDDRPLSAALNDTSTSSDDLGDVVELCLSLLAAVLIVVAVLRTSGLLSTSARVAIDAVPAQRFRCRAPDLAMLCVLRA